MDSRAYGATFHGLGLPDKFAYTMELAFRFIPTLACTRDNECHRH